MIRPEDNTDCLHCGKPFSWHPMCNGCGYTACDCVLNGDHRYCGCENPDPPVESNVGEFADRLMENGWDQNAALVEATRALRDAAIEDGM